MAVKVKAAVLSGQATAELKLFRWRIEFGVSGDLLSVSVEATTMEFNVFWRLNMIIDASNGKIINTKDVYIHDAVLEDFRFDRNEKKLHLAILKEWVPGNKKGSIDFLNVMGFEMTCCDFWGTSPHILDFEYVEQNNANFTFISRLLEKNNNNDFPLCVLNDTMEKYFETKITFTSGDLLTIACERIIM